MTGSARGTQAEAGQGAPSPYAIYDDAPPAGAPVLDLDPFSDEVFADPYPAHEQLREAGPLVWLSRYRVGAVARHDQVREMLGDWETFSSARGVGMEDFVRHGRFRLPSLILEADPPEHDRARQVLNKVLSPVVMRQLREGFEREADALVGDLLERGTFDGVADLAEAFALRVFPDAVGMSREGRDKLLPHAEMLFNSFGPRNALFERTRAKAEFEWIEAQGRRENLQVGGLGMLVHEAADRGEISQTEAPMLVRALLQAGLDTTINAMGSAIWCLARFPDQWARLRHDPGLARAAFEEAVRFECPVQTFFRTTTREVEIGGVTVPEGRKILMFLAAANRDPRQWPHPDLYDITRKPIGHVGFGVGIHMCVGQMLARLEGDILLTSLARRVGNLELVSEPVRRFNNTLRGFQSLPLRVRPA